jgi:serine phosphatase RsbU (regulator of sigma subunit)
MIFMDTTQSPLTGNQASAALATILKFSRQWLFSVGQDGKILGFLPRGQGLLGWKDEDIEGAKFDTLFRSNYVQVSNEGEEWDDLIYLQGTDGVIHPFGLRKLPTDLEPFHTLTPEAEKHLLLNELGIYQALENLHEKTLAEHAQELEFMNWKLKRQAHELRKTLEILEAHNRQMIQELNLAVELQKSLLPKSYPDTPSVAFTHRYIPLAMVGGDFFALASLGGDRVGILIADVSGHGVAPAFITAMIRSLFDYLHTREPSPAVVIRRINDEFAKFVNTDHFVTAFYGVFDFEAMKCTYCSAGHPPQLIIHRDGGVLKMEAEDPIIGMLEDHEYHDVTAPLASGDLLCFYTDGVQEARNAQDIMFGIQGITDTVIRNQDSDLETIADALITDLIQFMKDPVFEDDITILLGQVIESL